MIDDKFDLSEILGKEETRKFDYIRFTVSDINGIGRSKVVPRRHAEEGFKDGVTMSSAIMSVDARTNLAFTKEMLKFRVPNCKVMPCPNTFHEVAWSDKTLYKVGQVLCETFWINPHLNGSRQDGCTRYVLRKQLDRLEQLGFKFRSAFEAEFLVYNKNTKEPIFEGFDAYSSLRFAKFEDYLFNIEDKLYKSGIDISSIVIEHGEGQFEYCMDPVDGIRGADVMFLMRQAIKEMSQQLGHVATFMTKPKDNNSYNGLHLNMSLWKQDSNGELVNAFYDSSDVNNLSQIHRHWLAGLIKHGRALCALCCPTSNCYRRLHGFMMPSNIDWGIDDRSVAFRAKNSNSRETHLENRLPSGASNPYLVTSSTIAAGLDGILNQLPLPNPKTEDLGLNYPHGPEVNKPDTQREGCDGYFPFTLKDAIVALEEDAIIKDALGEQLIRWFVDTRTELDVKVMESIYDEEGRWQKEMDLFFEFM